jgi:polar amino acid transport system substrate-binding protein
MTQACGFREAASSGGGKMAISLKTVISLKSIVFGGTIFFLTFSGMVQGSAAQDTLERIKDAGFVAVGFANEAPYGYATPQGELTGEAPEIARVILEKLGVEQIDGVLTPFRGLIPGLQARRFDMVAAGMFITPERCEQVLFSEPTYAAPPGALVLKGNPKNIHSFQDFVDNPDLRLGVVAGGVFLRQLPTIGISEDQISAYPDGPSGRAAVEAGRIDAWAATGLTIQRLIDSASSGANIERVTDFGDLIIDGKPVLGHGAFAFRKEDEKFHEEFNSLLNDFVGTQEHLELVRPFGFTEAELPRKTMAQLCAGE